MFTKILLHGPDSSTIALGPVTVDSEMSVSAAVPGTLASGRYVVEWTTAAADGHSSSGRFTFDVATTDAPPPPSAAAQALVDTARTSAPDRPALPGPKPTGNMLVRIARAPDAAPSIDQYMAIRWMEFVALLTVIGAIIFRFAVLGVLLRQGEPTVDASDRARRLGQGGLFLLAFAALSRMYAELAVMVGPGGRLDYPAVREMLTTTTWGHGWLVGAVGVVVAAIGLTLAGRRIGGGWTLAAIGSLGIVVSPALTGHAIASPTRPLLAVALDALHVLAASGWLGTLLLVILAGIPAILRRSEGSRGAGTVALVNAFNPVALTCVTVVILTGAASAWMRLESVDAIWHSAYGRVLVVKLILLVAALASGAYNWRGLTPRLGDVRSPRRLRRSASIELLVGAAILAVTAVLVATSPPDRTPGDLSAAAAASGPR